MTLQELIEDTLVGFNVTVDPPIALSAIAETIEERIRDWCVSEGWVFGKLAVFDEGQQYYSDRVWLPDKDI